MGLVRFLLLITGEARSTLCRSSQTTLSKCFFLLTSSSVVVVVVVYAMLKATTNSRTLKALNVATNFLLVGTGAATQEEMELLHFIARL